METAIDQGSSCHLTYFFGFLRSVAWMRTADVEKGKGNRKKGKRETVKRISERWYCVLRIRLAATYEPLPGVSSNRIIAYGVWEMQSVTIAGGNARWPSAQGEGQGGTVAVSIAWGLLRLFGNKRLPPHGTMQ